MQETKDVRYYYDEKTRNTNFIDRKKGQKDYDVTMGLRSGDVTNQLHIMDLGDMKEK